MRNQSYEISHSNLEMSILARGTKESTRILVCNHTFVVVRDVVLDMLSREYPTKDHLFLMEAQKTLDDLEEMKPRKEFPEWWV